MLRIGKGRPAAQPIDSRRVSHVPIKPALMHLFRVPALAKRYSALSLLRHALLPSSPWPRAWRSPAPKPSYDVVLIGGGGHGLATAFYLAANHGIRNVAVIE